MNLIISHINSINHLCEKHKVKALYVFGSAAKSKFTESSDIDLLVDFESVVPANYFDNFMDLKESFEKLFHRKVDLLEEQTVKNPVLRKSIDRDKIQIYGRKDFKMAV
ncbi:MAG: nucleotidyltransferase family protein [Bacteroidia bacterium]